jgi:hypothetical protein
MVRRESTQPFTPGPSPKAICYHCDDWIPQSFIQRESTQPFTHPAPRFNVSVHHPLCVSSKPQGYLLTL